MKSARGRVFLNEMGRVVRWLDLLTEIVPYTPEGWRRRPLFPGGALLRIDFMRQWLFGMKKHVGLAGQVGPLSQRCLGLTKRGQPRHPLYVPADAPLVAASVR